MKRKAAMHELRPGVYRGHLPKTATAEDKLKQAARDSSTTRASAAILANLNRNAGKTNF